MARSSLSRLTGVNLQLVDGPGDTDLYLGNHIIYDVIAAYLPELRARVPDTTIYLRLIEGVNSFWADPARTAHQGADLVRRYPQADLVIPGNEQNHEFDADSGAIAAWCDTFLDAWAAEGWPRPVVTPAVSTGKPFDLSRLRASWARWDRVGVHAYTTFDDLGFNGAKAHVEAHRRMWPGKTLAITESNIEKLEETVYRHTEGSAAYEGFLHWCAAAGYIEACQWFLKDSTDNAHPYRMVKIPPLLNLHRALGHQLGGSEVPPPTPEPPQGDIARLEAIYRVSHRDSERVYLVELVERTDPPEITAVGPDDAEVVVETMDGAWRARGTGRASLAFSHPAQYQPISEGERGFYRATCEGAVVEGLGWAYDRPPCVQGPHTNLVPRFARRRNKPDTEPPPAGDGGWRGAFIDYYKANPRIGPAVGDIAYHPENDGSWDTAGQCGQDVLLIWDGWRVIQVDRT